MNRPSITVRAGTAADHPAWLTLWRGYQTFYNVDLPAQTTATTWERLLDPAEPLHLALAVARQRVVGLVHFIEHRTCWSPQNSFYLQDLFTDTHARGQGVGRALILHVYTQAAAMGIGRVHWLTQENNAQAMLLYDQVAEKPGFVQYRKTIAG